MNIRQIIPIIALCLFFAQSLQGQNKYLFGTTGQAQSNVLFSVGEPLTNMFRGVEVILYQGFVMPILVTPSSIPQVAGSPAISAEMNSLNTTLGELSVYPNPVGEGDVIVIRSKLLNEQSRQVGFFTVDGRQLSLPGAGIYLDLELSELRVKAPQGSGFYILVVPTVKGYQTKKILIR